MAPAGKNTTPGRRKRTDNQYFDVGKVGRKTGITLKDTGIRDENGLEPVSGIFSSPASAQQNGSSKALSSDAMDVQNSSAPDVGTTLSQRKTPRFPPPRQSTPRHTNIGSPRRMSSVKPGPRKHVPEDDEEEDTQPPANRRLDFGGPTNRNRRSMAVVDSRSPFKPKKVLRRSTGPARPDPFDLQDEDESIAKTSIEYTNGIIEEHDDENIEQSIEGDDGPIIMDDADDYPLETEQTEDQSQQELAPESPPKRKRGRPRKSDQSVNDSQLDESGPSKKRTRSSLENNQSVDDSTTSVAQGSMGPPPKRKRTSNGKQAVIHHEEGTEVVDASAIAYGDEYQADGHSVPEVDGDAQTQLDAQLETDQEAQPGKKSKGRPKGKKGKAAAAAKAESSKAAAQKRGSPVKLNDSPSKRARGGSAGPVSNVNLRATTPFEDADHQISRAGRNLIQPLKFWENESRIWRAGEIEGIIRAEHVEKPKPVKRKKKGRKTKGSRLKDIDEQSDTESIMPDEWEEEVGVITGTVANWNAATKAGDSNDPVQEDLAFASASIITRDVAGSEFKYAKIMTIPFFGAGVVELPPEGFKRAKNSRKMQMVFFVHEGKVLVEVGAMGLEVNSFALSKGGVWIVPRGNNYAITNESSTRTAKIFFAQGCVAEGAE